MRLKKYLGDREFWQGTLRLAVPTAIQNLLVNSFALVDTIMIGALGRNALAAVGMAGQWSWLMNLVFFGLNSGASVFYAQYWGVKDKKGIHRTFGLALASGLSAAMVFTLVGLFASEGVLRLFTSEEAVVAEGAIYLRYASFSYVMICLNNIFCTILRSTEQVKLPLYVSMVSVAANAVLNALFIFACGMGVKGAALATSVSSIISPALLLALSLRRDTILRLRVRDMFAWSAGFVRHYFAISLPVVCNEGLWALGTVIYRAMYSRKSTDFYAAYTILNSVEGMVFAFFVGICHACAVRIGKQVGMGAYDQAETDAKRYTILMPLVCLAFGSLVALCNKALLLPFASGQEQQILDMATVLLVIYGLELCVRNIPYITIVGVFRAGGDTRIGVLFDVGALWCITLPLVFVLTRYTSLPLPTVYLCMLLAEDLPKGAACILRLLSCKWIKPVTDAAVSRAAE